MSTKIDKKISIRIARLLAGLTELSASCETQSDRRQLDVATELAEKFSADVRKAVYEAAKPGKVATTKPVASAPRHDDDDDEGRFVPARPAARVPGRPAGAPF